ncbi:gas vesicle protein [Streptococcus dysgalactiae subsp. dysgalactiae]|uniref:Gas vesicle protein n=1 Tax=Streptococcus dysgalactiae subsp. dysgalactiae TaxID=99822 RepID=A0A380JXJ0_STRDY|nr:YtxH domain-containing protein [Streptococcus dysgalactiae]SUN50965.1 gas vesicle protein [Streptococcus dysgalactiae subsp. dysgalactiae]
MSKFFKTLVVGAASGAAAAYFLSTEKGKTLKNRAEKAYQAYKENPDDYHQLAKEKGSEYTHLARDTFYDVKDKLATGEVTKEEILELLKDKTTAFVQKTKETLAEVEAKENQDDIIIDYTQQDEHVSDADTSQDKY